MIPVPATAAPRGAKAPFFIAGSAPVALALIAIAATPFLLGASGGFVFDDYTNIMINPAFGKPLVGWRAWWEGMWSSPASDLSRPLAMLSFLVNFYFGGLNPLGFKVTNVLLHVGNGWLLWSLLRRLLRRPEAAHSLAAASLDPNWVALLLATAWTALAIHTSAILLVVQRMELLAQTFVVGGLLVYVLGRERQIDGRRGGMLLVASALTVFPALGILSKETAVLVPAYAFLIEVYLLRFRAQAPSSKRQLLTLYGLLFAAGVLAACLFLPAYLDPAIWARRNFTLGERLLTESRVIWEYVRWILAPDLTSLSLYHDNLRISRGLTDPVSTLVAVVAWTFVLALLLRLARRPSLFALGIAWFACAHLLTGTVLPLELIFEHRNYFASIGLLLAAVPICARVMTTRRRVRLIAAGVGLFILAQMSIAAVRAHEWSHPLRHAGAEAARNPDSPRAIYEFARVLFALSERDPASPLYAQAIANFERAARLPGASTMPEYALLLVASLSGAPIKDEWWQMLQDKLRSRPIDIQSGGSIQDLVHCQLVGECKFPEQTLARTLAIAASQVPPNADVLNAYSDLALERYGDKQLAEVLSHDALALDPKSLVRIFNYGRTLALVGKYDEALAQAAEMERLDRMGRMRSNIAALREMIEELRKSRESVTPASAPTAPASLSSRAG